MRKFRLNLTLFGDEGAAAPAPADTASGTAAPSPATKEEKKPAPKVLYGKQEQVTEADPSTRPQETATAEESFDELIKGKYKEDYEKALKGHLDSRLKRSAAIESEHASMLEMLKKTAEAYGINPESKTLIEDVRKAQEGDEELLAKEARESGMSVEEYKHKRETDALKAKIAENDRRTAHAAWVKSLRDQVPEVQKRFPDFDLDTEMQNRDFAYLVRPGSPIKLEDALYAVHHRDILSGAVKTAASVAAQQTANAVAANRARPSEGGLANTPATVIKDDPSKWTKEDRAEVRRRVLRGEKIKL